MHIKHLESAWGGEVTVMKPVTGDQVKMCDLTCLSHSSFVGQFHTISLDQGESNFSSISYVPLYFP